MSNSHEPRLNQVVIDREGYFWLSTLDNDGNQKWYCPRAPSTEMAWTTLAFTRGPLEVYTYERTVIDGTD
jgi:hypothetical protein